MIYLDALVVKVRDGAHVANRAAHIAIGVDMDRIKHVLGIWIQASEGAKFWASVCSQLANRGLKDVLIVCCDGLTGFPEAIEQAWPKAVVQTCVVHLIRASMRFVSYTDRKAVAAMLRPIYTAADEDAALMALATFADPNLGKKYPAAVLSVATLRRSSVSVRRPAASARAIAGTRPADDTRFGSSKTAEIAVTV